MKLLLRKLRTVRHNFPVGSARVIGSRNRLPTVISSPMRFGYEEKRVDGENRRRIDHRLVESNRLSEESFSAQNHR
jgi:hypothetical protein